MSFRSLEEFWAFYMSQHSKASTRGLHFVGTLSGIVITICSLLFNWKLLIMGPIIGYGLAWYSHFFVEKNVPATFGHPIWSFICDCKMFGLMLTGGMDREIKRLGKRPLLHPFWISSVTIKLHCIIFSGWELLIRITVSILYNVLILYLNIYLSYTPSIWKFIWRSPSCKLVEIHQIWLLHSRITLIGNCNFLLVPISFNTSMC